MRPMIKRLLPFIALLALASPAGASIGLLRDGRAMKVSAYKVVGENEMQLTLKSGGAITVPLTRIDRVVDDEVVPAVIVEEVKKAVEKDGGIFPTRSWRYDETRGPIFKSKFDKLIVEAAKKFDVDAALVSAVIRSEERRVG